SAMDYGFTDWLHEEKGVGQAGEIVVGGEEAHARFRLFALGDIVDNDHCAAVGHRAVRNGDDAAAAQVALPWRKVAARDTRLELGREFGGHPARMAAA